MLYYHFYFLSATFLLIYGSIFVLQRNQRLDRILFPECD